MQGLSGTLPTKSWLHGKKIIKDSHCSSCLVLETAHHIVNKHTRLDGNLKKYLKGCEPKDFLKICQFHCPEVNPIFEGIRAYENGIQVGYDDFWFEAGLVALDGSAKHARWPGFATAGAAAYQLTATGVVKALIWTIPDDYPQSAAASEQLAADNAIDKVKPGVKVDLLVDCLAVQLCFLDLRQASRCQSKFGGLWKQPKMRDRINTIHNIKSHMTKEQALAAGTNMDWWAANQAVDALANQALRDDKFPEDEEWAEAVTPSHLRRYLIKMA